MQFTHLITNRRLNYLAAFYLLNHFLNWSYLVLVDQLAGRWEGDQIGLVVILVRLVVSVVAGRRTRRTAGARRQWLILDGWVVDVDVVGAADWWVFVRIAEPMVVAVDDTAAAGPGSGWCALVLDDVVGCDWVPICDRHADIGAGEVMVGGVGVGPGGADEQYGMRGGRWTRWTLREVDLVRRMRLVKRLLLLLRLVCGIAVGVVHVVTVYVVMAESGASEHYRRVAVIVHV